MELSDTEFQESLKKPFNISIDEFIALNKYGITLDHLFILDYIHSDGDISTFNSKLEALRVGLIRKGYLDKDNKVTTAGLLLLEGKDLKEGVGKGKVEFKKIKEKIKTDFDRWWEVYPSTDYFTYKGKEFLGSQSKHKSKEECMKLFDSYIGSGLFSAEEMIKATEKHIEIAKRTSFSKGENQLTFIANSERYLMKKFFNALKKHIFL
jgi:hypothetical protein